MTQQAVEGPPSEPPRTGRALLILAAAGCAVGLLIIGIVAMMVGTQIWKASRELGRAEKKTVHSFFEAAGKADYAGARDLFTRNLASQKSLSQLEAEIEANPDAYRVTEIEFDEKSEIQMQKRKIEFMGKLKLRDGRTIPTRFTLVVEDGYWLIDSYSVGS